MDEEDLCCELTSIIDQSMSEPSLPTEPSEAGGSARGTKKGKQKEKDVPTCLCCDEPRCKGQKWCKLHKRTADAMLYQAKEQEKTEPGAMELYQRVMADESAARQEVLAFALQNPPDARYKRKQCIQWAQWRKVYGQRTLKSSCTRDYPMTEGEFLKWAVGVKAIPDEEAAAWWKELRNNPHIDRDKGGRGGRLQLYVPRETFRENKKEEYIDERAEEGSEQIRRPREADHVMLRDHLRRQETSFADDFFTPTKKRGGMESEPSEPTPAKKAKQETAAKVNLPVEVPKLYCRTDNALAACVKGMKDALTSLQNAKGKVDTYDEALKKDDLAHAAYLATVDARMELLSRFFAQETTGAELQQALGTAGGEGAIQLLQSEAELQKRAADLLTLSTPEDFAREQAWWPKLFAEMKGLTASCNKVSSELINHLKTKVRLLERAAKTEAKKQQADEAKRQREENKKKADEIKLKRTGQATPKPVYTLTLSAELVPQVRLLEGDAAAVADWSLPFCRQHSDSVALCFGDAAFSKSLTAFAATHGKMKEAQSPQGRVQQWLQAKTGKEAADELWKQQLPETVADISEVAGGEVFMASTWCVGYQPHMQHTSLNTNCAAMLRGLVMGSVRVLCIELLSLLQAAQKAAAGEKQAAEEQAGEQKPDETTLDSVFDSVEGITQERLAELAKDGVKLLQHTLQKNELLYAPMGWITVEQLPGDVKLCYGVRKSFMLKGEASTEAYKKCITLFARSGRNIERMQQIANILAK